MTLAIVRESTSANMKLCLSVMSTDKIIIAVEAKKAGLGWKTSRDYTR